MPLAHIIEVTTTTQHFYKVEDNTADTMATIRDLQHFATYGTLSYTICDVSDDVRDAIIRHKENIKELEEKLASDDNLAIVAHALASGKEREIGIFTALVVDCIELHNSQTT